MVPIVYCTICCSHLQLIDSTERQYFVSYLLAVCRVPTDVVFVLDASGSVSAENYERVRNYT